MSAQTDTSTTGNTTQPNIDIGTPYAPRRPAPLVSISVNHPFAQAARKIKNFLVHKQTLFSTSFTIKVTPIVALVSLFGVATLFGGGLTTAYNFGKTVEQKFLSTSPTPTQKITPIPVAVQVVSLAGTIKATYQLPVVNSNGFPVSPIPTISPVNTSSSSATPLPTTLPTPTPAPTVLHYILVSRSGSIHYLASPLVNLQNYINLRVLITGSLDTAKNTLTISKSTDIEVLQ